MIDFDKYRHAYFNAYGVLGKGDCYARNAIFLREIKKLSNREPDEVPPHKCKIKRTEQWSAKYHQTMIVEWRH